MLHMSIGTRPHSVRARRPHHADRWEGLPWFYPRRPAQMAWEQTLSGPHTLARVSPSSTPLRTISMTLKPPKIPSTGFSVFYSTIRSILNPQSPFHYCAHLSKHLPCSLPCKSPSTDINICQSNNQAILTLLGPTQLYQPSSYHPQHPH